MYKVGGHQARGFISHHHPASPSSLPLSPLQAITFVCNQWLASKDPAIFPSVELYPGGSLPELLRYCLLITTSDLRGAATDAKVSVELVGGSGRVGPVLLENPAAFERAQVRG